MTAADVATALLLVLGGFFFLAGTVGLLRFPDALSRLHALTKADNVGLGFVVAALALQAPAAAPKLLLIWLLALLSSTTSAQLIARVAQRVATAATAHGRGGPAGEDA